MTKIRILVGCERSQKVAEALRKEGFEAYSCDLTPGDKNLPYHIQADLREVLKWGIWDVIIAFVPCTHLCVSGARWFKLKAKEQEEAVNFFLEVWNTPCKFKAMENPIGIMSKRLRKPDQIIQPWQFGHGETKATCLWLDNLPALKPTNIVEGREARVHKLPPSKDRAKLRGETYQGIADAMAKQWGAYFKEKGFTLGEQSQSE